MAMKPLLQTGDVLIAYDDNTIEKAEGGVLEIVAAVIEMQNQVITDLEHKINGLRADLENHKNVKTFVVGLQ